MFEDKTITLTCVCGCGSIRFDLFAEEPEVCVTPYALMSRPIIMPNSIWNRVRLAWGVLFGKYPEPTMIIDQDEVPLLHEFLHQTEKALKKKENK